MRTTADILAYRVDRKDEDVLGFESSVMLEFLPLHQLLPLLNADHKLEEWTASPLTPEYVIGKMKDYMDFAWGKVSNHRGISAERSVSHYRGWLWLLGDDRMVQFMDTTENYAQYGAPILKRICEQYDFAVPGDDRIMRMMRGLDCVRGCEEGCGS